MSQVPQTDVVKTRAFQSARFCRANLSRNKIARATENSTSPSHFYQSTATLAARGHFSSKYPQARRHFVRELLSGQTDTQYVGPITLLGPPKWSTIIVTNRVGQKSKLLYCDRYFKGLTIALTLNIL